MKKGLAMLLAAAMVLAMGMTAFAAPSRDSNPYGVTSPQTQVVVDTATSTEVKAAQDYAASLNKNANVLAVVDVNPTKDFPAGGMTITLEAAGIKKGDNIVLYHQVYKDGQWVWETIIPSEVGDGYVKAFFKSLSPVAIVKLPANSSAATTGTSPKTGYWG